MAKRPDVFDQSTFQTSLRGQGCPESFVSPVTSDLRLLVPLALRAVGEEGLLELFESSRSELGLGEQTEAWKVAVKYITGWAVEVLEDYKLQK